MCLFRRCHLALWKQPCRMENDLLALELRTSASLLCWAAAAEISTGNNKQQRGCNSLFHATPDGFHHRIDSRSLCSDITLICADAIVSLSLCLFVCLFNHVSCCCRAPLTSAWCIHVFPSSLLFFWFLTQRHSPLSGFALLLVHWSLCWCLSVALRLVHPRLMATHHHHHHHHFHLLTGHHPLTSHHART